jgi:hypothetical protein
LASHLKVVHRSGEAAKVDRLSLHAKVPFLLEPGRRATLVADSSCLPSLSLFSEHFGRYGICDFSRMPLIRRFVYVLKNHDRPSRYYTGATSNIMGRLAAHNAGHCSHTAGRGP